jgi:plastocyanin
MSHRTILIGVAMWLMAAAGVRAQAPIASTTVRGRVEVISGGAEGQARHGAIGRAIPRTIPGTVVWLTSMTGGSGDANAVTSNSAAAPVPNLRLVQKNKSFAPHILVVPAGSQVEFPNRDPFFHNVFSLFEGKRFDLGLYEAGTSRVVRFDRPGISYIFCNIHPEMSAVVITLATPLYAIASADGQLTLAGVPYGHYLLHVWSEGMGGENTQPLTREITIAANSASLGVIRVPEGHGQGIAHKNKYGREYDEPTPNSPVYEQHR